MPLLTVFPGGGAQLAKRCPGREGSGRLGSPWLTADQQPLWLAGCLQACLYAIQNCMVLRSLEQSQEQLCFIVQKYGDKRDRKDDSVGKQNGLQYSRTKGNSKDTAEANTTLRNNGGAVQQGAPQGYSCVEFGHEVTTCPLPEELLREEKAEQLPWKPEAVCRREVCTAGVHQPLEVPRKTKQSNLQPQEVQPFPTQDIHCQEEVGGDRQQPVKELQSKGKGPRKARKWRLEEQTKLADCGADFCFICGRYVEDGTSCHVQGQLPTPKPVQVGQHGCDLQPPVEAPLWEKEQLRAQKTEQEGLPTHELVGGVDALYTCEGRASSLYVCESERGELPGDRPKKVEPKCLVPETWFLFIEPGLLFNEL
ncbi:UNVERIFIED_CONTAM: hypothetical protein FKN15_065610 [Acipenser sinensis]